MDMLVEVRGNLTVNGNPGKLKDYLQHKLPHINQARQELLTQYQQLEIPDDEGSVAQLLSAVYIGYV